MTANCGDEERPLPELGERLAPLARCARFPAGSYLPLDEAIYFPLDAIATLMLEREKTRFQVGFAAKGDAIGLQRLFSREFPPMCAKVLKAGDFICVSPEALTRLMRDDRRLKERLSSYALRATCRFLDEAARTVALTLERRVARWIALCRDAIGKDVLPVSHQELATSLGVRRAGVTVALHMLEGEHLIRSRRMRIEVLDRQGLTAYSLHGTVPPAVAGSVAAIP